jgi:hypothetical protein
MRGSRLSDWKLKSVDKSSGESSRGAVPTYEGSQMKTSVSRDARDLSDGLDTDFNTISNSLRDDEKGCCIIL